MKLLRNALTGLGLGAAATIPMTGEFWLARRAGLIDELPPHKAVRSALPRLPEPRLSSTSAAAHLAVGGLAGATYGLLMPRPLRGVVSGAAFGLCVWAVGYEIVMPMVTDIAPAHRDQRSRAVTIFIAHVIFGVALGTSAAKLGKRQL